MREIRIESPFDDGTPCAIELKIKPGDRLRPGTIIAILETNVATQELESFEACIVVGIVKTSKGFVLQLEEA